MTFLSGALERNHGNIMSLNNMVVLSFLLHALIISIIFFSPSLPSPRWTFGPSYTVDLVSLPSSSVDIRSSEASYREVVGLNRKNRSIIIKKDVAKSLNAPVRETKIQRKSTSGIKKRVASTAEGSLPATSRGHSEMNMKMKVYYSIVWSMIKEKWALPEGILPGDNIEAIIEAKILRNGSVSNLSFEKNSGNRYFDESAIKAIKKAKPFPPLPEWLDERYIDLGIRFHSSEL